jgi:glycosyltransferase involved in cell wall biosynthesis
LGDGAEGIHIREMIHAFRSLGHTVTVVAPAGENHPQNNPKVGFLGTIKSALPGFLFEFCEILYSLYSFISICIKSIKIKPDFIYDRYITYNLGGVIAARVLKIPIFLEVNAPLALERTEQPDEKLYFKKIAFSIERWVCSNATKTIVVSTPLKNYLISIGVNAGKIFVLPNGVNHEKFLPHEKDGNLLLNYGLAKSDTVIGFTGILRAWHGLELLLDSFRAISQEYEHVFLLIVGDGPIRNDLEDSINNFNLKSKVTITGRIPYNQVHEYVNLFDIAVSPKSTFYASPMKVVEYMALGKAVVTPNEENFLDLIDVGKNGMVFNSESEDGLTIVLKELLQNTNLITELGSNARKKVQDQLNWHRNGINICHIYDDQLKR